MKIIVDNMGVELDLSEICVSDFFEKEGLDAIVSILPVMDVDEATCFEIQDRLNGDGDFSGIAAPEEVLCQAQVIYDRVDYDSVEVLVSSEGYLVFQLNNHDVKEEEENDVKLVAPDDLVVIETADGDFLVKSRERDFVEFLDEELGDGIGDDSEMTEIVDGVNSSVKLSLCDPDFIRNGGNFYSLVGASKAVLLQNLLNAIEGKKKKSRYNGCNVTGREGGMAPQATA